MRGWLIVLAAVALAGSVRAGKEPDLTTVKSDDGRFALKFIIDKRGRVPEEKTTVKTPSGPLVVNWMSVAATKDTTISVHWTDYGPETDVSNPSKLFAAARDAAVGKKGKLMEENELSPLTVEKGEEKIPGREFRIEQGDKSVRTRLYLHGSRLYQVTVAGPKKEVNAEWADKYIKSFVVLN